MLSTIDPSIVAQVSSSLPPAERDKFKQRIAQLGQLPASDLSLPSFLTAFAQAVADVYAASCVAIWFRTPDGEIERRVDVGWPNIGLDEMAEAPHQQLITYAIRQPDPLSVKPFSAPAAGIPVSNPTDSFLLLASIHHEAQPVAVLELALGPKPLRRPHEALVSRYLAWLNWLAEVLQDGLQRRYALGLSPLDAALTCLERTTNQVAEMQDRIRMAIRDSLASLAGNNFGSFEANQQVTKQVHTLLDSKGLRASCPECGSPAILRCQKAGNSKTGAFVFDHYLESGRTFHGGASVFPRLNLVSKPPRRTSK